MSQNTTALSGANVQVVELESPTEFAQFPVCKELLSSARKTHALFSECFEALRETERVFTLYLNFMRTTPKPEAGVVVFKSDLIYDYSKPEARVVSQKQSSSVKGRLKEKCGALDMARRGPAMSAPDQVQIKHQDKSDHKDNWCKHSEKCMAICPCKIRSCVLAIVEVLTINGMKSDARTLVDVENTIKLWVSFTRMADGDWIKCVKYLICSFVSYWYDDIQPTPPSLELAASHVVGQLLCGSAGRYLRKQMLVGRAASRSLKSILTLTDSVFTQAVHFHELVESILHSKTGMPRPDEDYCLAEKRSTFKALTTKEPEFEQYVCGGIVVTKELLISELKRTTIEVLGNNPHISPREWEQPRVPSTSAHYNESKKFGGALGATCYSGAINDPMDGIRQPGGYVNTPIDLFAIWRACEKDLPIYLEPEPMESSDALQRLAWSGFLRNLDKEIENEACVSLVALSEALKVRIISKGPARLQTKFRPLQKFLWQRLQAFQCFELTGTPITGEYMTKALGQLHGEQKYLSGDYKAATNNLRRWCSEAVCEQVGVSLGLDSSEMNDFLKLMTRHTIQDPDNIEGLVDQQTGQLMGSVVSFPILCIVNAALTRFAYENTDMKGHECPLSDLPGAFNGDDIALRCSHECRQAWAQVTSSGGLSESMGKTYFSCNFVNMNSACFIPGINSKGDFVLERIGKINLGLIKGMSRSEGSDKERVVVGVYDPRGSMGLRYREMMKTCPERFRPMCHERFLENHMQKLKSTRLPWFVPEWLGGLGLTGFRQPSPLDSSIATLMLKRGYKKPVDMSKPIADYHMWELAEKRVTYGRALYECPDPEDIGVKAYDREVGKALIDVLLDEDIGFQDIYVKEKREIDIKMVRRNERLWCRATYKFDLGKIEPLAWSEWVTYRTYKSLTPYWGKRHEKERTRACEGKFPTPKTIDVQHVLESHPSLQNSLRFPIPLKEKARRARIARENALD